MPDRPPVFRDLIRELDEARELRHPRRLMRVTLECGHLRLMPKIDTIMGIGAHTTCPNVCEGRPTRLVVNIEETGAL